MKLTIKTENGQKVVDLKNDLQFNALKGEQYVFSNGFSNYVLNFKDNQESVVLTFTVDGKNIKIELNGIVPYLQANTANTLNPTAIIINKDVNDKDVDNILENNAFNGSEIIDRLEALLSRPVELGENGSDNLTLISDYQTLLEALDAAAAGAEAGNAGSDGSTFNSIFSLNAGGLSDIAETDRWENLTESISNIPVETGETIAVTPVVPAPEPINVNVKLVGVDTAVTEGENATYKVTLTNDAGTPVVAVEDMEVTFTYTYTTAEGNDITETVSVIIPAGSSEAPVSVKTIDDVYAEGTEEFTIEINTVSNQDQFENVTVDKTPVVTTITDETGPYTPDTPDTPNEKDNVNVKLVGVDTAVTEGENATYKVTLTNDAGTPVVAVEDMEVTFTYTYTTAEGNDITETVSVIIPAGSSEAPVSVKTIDDVYAEGTEEFTIEINTVSNQDQFENVTVDKTPVVTTITDETGPYTPDTPDTPNEKDNVNVKLVGVDTAVTEGENATYKVTLTNDAGTPVVAVEDMEVTFTYTYTTAEGNDITETVSVIIPAGSSEAPVSVKTIDDVYAEGTEEFTIEINTVSNQDQFENVTVDKTPVVTTITDETGPYTPDTPDTPNEKDNVNVKLVGVDTAVTEGENATYKVTLTNDAGTPVVAVEDMEVTFTYTYTTAEGNDITETVSVIIPAGSSEAPVSVKTIDDVYAEGTEEFTIEINTVSNQDQFENVTVDKTPVVTTITDETGPYTPDTPDTPNEKDNVNVKLVGVDTAVTEGENATYKVTLTNDAGTPVVAVEDMEVTFTYTYTTAEGNDITETVSVIIPAGSSEAPVSVKTIDDVYAEGTEEFTIEINTVSNQDQFENVTVDKTPVVTTITDETGPYTPDTPDTPNEKDNVNVKLVGVDTAVTEGENATYKVTLTNDAGTPVVAVEDMEVTFTYTYTTAEGNDITETVSVIIPAGSSEAPVSVKTIDDVYAEGTEEFTIEINTVSNQDQFENVTVDKTPVVTTITDETGPYTPDTPDTPNEKDNVNVKLVGVDTAVTEGENATYKVTLTNDAGTPVVAVEDMEVTFTYTYTTAEGNDITETVSVIIPAGSSEAPVSVKTIDDVYAEGTEEFTIEINTVSNQDQFENVTVDKTPVVTTITDETGPYTPDTPDTPNEKDNVNVKLVGVDTAVTEGENATYKVTLTNDAGTPVVAVEDMEVTFTYTYTTAEGNDITETVSVIIPAGSSEAPVSVKTIDDVYAEGTEEFTIEINTVSNQDQFENVTVDKTPVVTTITDETGPYTPDTPDTPNEKDNVNVKLVGVDTAVTEGENATYKVTLTNDAGTPVVAVEDMEVTFTYTYTTAEGNDITETVSVIIPAGSSEAPVSVKTIDDVYAEGTEEFTIEINTVSNQDQFENVTVDKTPVVTTITDETGPYTPDTPDTPNEKDNVNVKLVGVDTAVTEGENATYKVTLTNDAGTPVVAVEDMEVTFTYTYTTAEGNDITETVSVIIPAGSSEAPVSVKTIDDVYAEGTEEFTIEINTVSNQDQFENVTVDKTPVVTTITDETGPYTPDTPDTPNEKDNVNVKLVGVDTAVTEGENATYKVTLTNDAGTPVVAVEDMEVTFTYTYTTAEGNDITETVSVIIPAGSSEAPVSVKTIDDVYAEGTEEFTIEINTVSNQDQFENVTVDKTPVVTTITDETGPYTPDTPDTPNEKDNVNVKLVGVDTAVTEGENATYKVTLTNDAGTPVVAVEDMEVTFTYTYTTAEGNDITETVSVIIPAGSSEAPVSVKTIDDVYAEGTEEFTIEINTVSNQDQFENVTVDKTPVVTTITDETGPYTPDTPDTPNEKDNVNVKLVGVDTAVTEGENATYKVTLTNDAGTPVVAVEDMEVTFTYTYTTAEGNDITETVSVIIPAGSSEAPVSVKTIDDNIYEISEEFTIEINTVSNQDQFENVTVDKTPVVTIINDEDRTTPGDKDGDKPVLIITGSTVEEKESGISTGEKVIGTVEISISNGKVFAEDLNITLSTGQIVTIKAGETTTGPINVETNRIDDYYKQGTTTYDVSIQEVSNSKIDITGKTASITVKDDIDPIGIEITATATAPKIIDVNTEFNELTGVKISATDTDGNPKNISVVTGTNHDGFGVEGNTTGGGASSELGNLGNGKSEKLIFEFDKDINSLDIAFAWRNNGETARITFINDGSIVGYAEVKGGGSNTKANVNYYTPDGELIRTVEAQGGTDRVDLSYTFELVNNDGSLVSFDQVEFTAPNHDDDYLINKISYKEVVNPEVTDISADSGSVTFDIQLQHPPQGNATAKIEVNGVIYDNVIINATGRATLTVDGNDLGDLSNVVIKVLEINGGNYEKVNSVEETFDFTPVLKSSDDSITTNEDESYILKVTDFGEVSVNTKEFKITELPNPESGKLYLLVKQGETIIDKEGNITVATQDTKVEIFQNQIVKLADVGAEKVIFEAKANSDIDGNFKFEVGDGKGKFSEEYTTVIQVVAVADVPTASIDVTKIASSTTEYKVDITAALADTDGSETLNVKIAGVPTGVTLSSDVYTLVDNGDNTWTVTIPTGIKSISDSITMNVPESYVNNIVLEITARATETNDNANGQNFAEVVITDKQDAPEIENITVNVSEEGLPNGIKDADGIVDTTDETKITGTVKITDANNDISNVTLSVPSSDLKSNGQVIVWTLNNTEKELIGKVGTTEVIKVMIDNDGKYSVELLAPVDHPVNSVEDIVSLDVGVKVIDSLGNISNGKIVVNIEDDMPKSCSVTNEIDIQKDIVVIKNLEAGFKDSIYLNGTNEVTNTNTDGDTLIDRIQWGTPADSNNGQSGYNLVDNNGYTNSIGTQIDTNGAFKLADFTHQNWTIDGKSSTLDKTTITMKMDVVINGKAVSVAFDVLLDHDETPNSNDAMASRDIITLPENDITINVDGQNYTFTVEGFRNLAGEYVKTIYTNETANNSFEIFASIKQAVDLPVISGNVCADAGADGLAAITWENLNSQYGTMSVDANGGYVFTVNQTTKDNLEIGESLTQDFTYTIMDKDGDKSTNTVTIKINGIAVPNAIPTTTDDSISTFEDTEKILYLEDFGTYSDADTDSLTSVKIVTLPDNGVLTLNGVAIVAGVVISASDISSGKLKFTPNSNTDEDSSFTFQVSDGKDWSLVHTTTVEIIAVADALTASIDVTKVVSSTSDIIVKLGDSTYNITELLANKNDSIQFLQKSNVGNNYDMDNDNTTKITVNGGLNQNDMVGGTVNNDIIIINGDVKSGTNINSTDGNDIVAILGNIYGGSFAGDNGIDYLYLGKAMDKYEILNYNGYEQGHPDMDFQLKDKDTGGILVVNNIEGIIFADGNTFGKVNIVKETTVEYIVDISAALTDTDGSEALTATISGVPAGATFDSQYVINDNGVWKIVVPQNATSINYTDVKMTVPLSVGTFSLKIEAIATEKSNNHSVSTHDSDAIVYAINETNTLTFGKATTNLLFTLDVSGSMNDKVLNSSGKYTTRFEIAKESMIETIKAYKVNGITEVNLTLFNSGAKNIGWKTADDAIDYLSKLTMNKDGYILYEGQFISGLTSKSTDYYDALNATMSINFTGHKADNTVAYFLSDGEPRDNTSATNDDGDDIIKAWKDYVKENIQTLNVIGVGSGAEEGPLKIIQVQDGDKVIMVKDDSTLGNILLGTVTASISGTVADNIFGGDGVKTINSIVVDGNEYTKTNFPTDGIALDGDGKLVFNFDTGAYTYSSKSSEFISDTTKTFEVNVSDEDGDKASFDVNLKIDITPNETITTLNTSDEDTIDLTSLINNSYKNVTDVVDMTNNKVQTLKIDMNDVIDLVDADKQLVIKGDLEDKVQLDTPSDWSNAGKEQLDGVNYNVYKGIGLNSTIKLLIEDDIDVTPDI